jgi:hypothetical protein
MGTQSRLRFEAVSNKGRASSVLDPTGSAAGAGLRLGNANDINDYHGESSRSLNPALKCPEVIFADYRESCLAKLTETLRYAKAFAHSVGRSQDSDPVSPQSRSS